jgi:hypothetical protein
MAEVLSLTGRSQARWSGEYQPNIDQTRILGQTTVRTVQMIVSFDTAVLSRFYASQQRTGSDRHMYAARAAQDVVVIAQR